MSIAEILIFFSPLPYQGNIYVKLIADFFVFSSASFPLTEGVRGRDYLCFSSASFPLTEGVRGRDYLCFCTECISAIF
jgi:hypothetical protein